MSKTKAQLFEQYLKLRAAVDTRCAEMDKLHSEHLKCEKGCSSCCIKFSVFPLEFFYIKEQLQQNNIPLNKPELKSIIGKQCVFIKQGACTIYEHRPLICRTQGYPLMYQNMSGDGYELSACNLNFKQFDFGNFTIDNSVFMPPFNSELFLLNKDFVQNELSLSPTKRMPIKKLLSDMKKG